MAEIFDKIVLGLNKGVTTVGATSKAVLEKAKINAEINEFQKDYDQLIQLLGQRVYDMYQEVGDVHVGEITGFFERISHRLESISQYKDKIKRIDEELSNVVGSASSQEGVACSCGYTNPRGAKFCARCGKQI